MLPNTHSFRPPPLPLTRIRCHCKGREPREGGNRVPKTHKYIPAVSSLHVSPFLCLQTVLFPSVHMAARARLKSDASGFLQSLPLPRARLMLLFIYAEVFLHIKQERHLAQIVPLHRSSICRRQYSPNVMKHALP